MTNSSSSPPAQVSLTISIVLSVDVFLLCLIEIIPPTSFVVPLLGQYLLFTLTLVTVSVVATVYVLNISFRNASSHKMTKFEQWLYLDLLPRLLRMRKLREKRCDEVCHTKLVHCGPSSGSTTGTGQDSRQKHGRKSSPANQSSRDLQDEHRSHLRPGQQSAGACRCPNSSLPHSKSLDSANDFDEHTISLCPLNHHEVKNAFLSLDFVAKRTENKINHNQVSVWIESLQSRATRQYTLTWCTLYTRRQIEDDWRFVATVIDRLLLWVFSSVCIIGTALIILQAPALYDNQEPIDLKLSKLGPKMRPNLPDSFDEDL